MLGHINVSESMRQINVNTIIQQVKYISI